MNPRTLMTAWPIPLLSPGSTRSAVGPVTVIVSVEARLGWMAVWFDRSLNEPATKLTVTVPGDETAGGAEVVAERRAGRRGAELGRAAQDGDGRAVSDRVNWPPVIAAVSSVSPMAGWKVTSM